MTVGAAAVGGRVRAAGCAVDDAVPEPYATGTTKNAKDRDAYPTVVASDAGLTLRTKSFGVRRLRCHCVFDGWMGKTTWRAAAMAPKGRCAVVATRTGTELGRGAAAATWTVRGPRRRRDQSHLEIAAPSNSSTDHRS